MKSYEFLDDEITAEKLISFRSKEITKIRFNLPSIHCSSCLWLLENLPRLHSGIRHCKVNILSKNVAIDYSHSEISLKELVELLAKIGYEPELNFAFLNEIKVQKFDRSLIIKIGVAGFCFGNIMLLSFPEYLGLHGAFKSYFLGYINILLSLPVLLYAGRNYLVDAYKNLVNSHLGIHFPLALGMLALFLRSVYEITFGVGEGYLDSFSGFVFFLLLGQWYQNRTQKHLNFDRDYRSYFPISVDVLDHDVFKSKTIDQVRKGDIIRVRNMEIIPCDGKLLSTNCQIDYSFVTGESEVHHKEKGAKIYAGGRQKGAAIKIKVTRSVEQGYLTTLWNEQVFKIDKSSSATLLLDKISKYFSLVILTIAVLTFIYWINKDTSIAYTSLTSVLIVACPCALAISVPFILGNAMRILAKRKFYVRSIHTIEKFADIDTVIFDKTGTITENNGLKVSYYGQPLNSHDMDMIVSLTSHSNHPFSKAISQHYQGEHYQISDFQEIPGRGIIGRYGNYNVRLGSGRFIFNSPSRDSSKSFVEINGQIYGYFKFNKRLRSGIKELIGTLKHYKLALLSGDGSSEFERMQGLFPKDAELRFNQSPKDKLAYIKNLQSQGHSVMMIGDGLNDAGALKQSDIGVVVVEDNNNFTPACDVMISADHLFQLKRVNRYFTKLRHSLYGAFVIAFLYNVIGLSFAVSGQLSPIVAAILMPLSSITIILYSILTSKISAFVLNHDAYQPKE
ncbi:heavy metal translocating P-type ATPase [Portibacter marinus]|uniref:heavy metal translocating P-type ATPase n=1 Tax=Portibacter marinus TaxID=2898660 RepID=UPI001F3D3CB9|nr:HAD-IC family P-type ATPase [Portibacter marinus]